MGCGASKKNAVAPADPKSAKAEVQLGVLDVPAPTAAAPASGAPVEATKEQAAIDKAPPASSASPAPTAAPVAAAPAPSPAPSADVPEFEVLAKLVQAAFPDDLEYFLEKARGDGEIAALAEALQDARDEEDMASGGCASCCRRPRRAPTSKPSLIEAGERRLRELLQEATQGTDVKALTGALEHARSGGVEPELIEAGERRLRELPTLNLQTAMQGSDTRALAVALAQAKEHGVDQELIRSGDLRLPEMAVKNLQEAVPGTNIVAAFKLTVHLLETLAAKQERVTLPVLKTSQRRRSGLRGLSRAALYGLRAFYAKRGALDKAMQDIVNEPGFAFSACELTKSTGLSLAESLVLAAGGGDGIEALVGEATSFFSYCWVGTKLRDMLDAIEKILAALEADGKRRYVWIDILCASQNLLQGVIKDPAMSSAEVGIEDAISTVGELLFYMEPLAGSWAAPPHPFLLAEQGEPEAGWVRSGPAALTRAWCIFELAKALAKGCSLHVLLSPASVALFERRMTMYGTDFEDGLPGFEWVAKLLGGIDVKRAQISFVKDREYIVGEVAKLEGGMGAINSNVMGALRGWLTTEAKALLAKMPKRERGTSVLINNVSVMLEDGGRLAEAEVLKRKMLAACRAKYGKRDPDTLIALGNLAVNLSNQRKHAEAEPLFREALAASREVLGDDDEDTQMAVGNLGEVLLEQGKLDEAEPLCVEAAAWFRANMPDDVGTVSYVGNLVDLRRQQGRLAEAEQELGSLVADARAGLGPQHQDTLEVEAVAARLQHAQPDGAAAGAAELRGVVERMGEFLGEEHPSTLSCLGELGNWLQEQGKLDEAEPMILKALAWTRKEYGPQNRETVSFVGSLVELRRRQGRLAEAEQELGSLVADARAGLGPQHPVFLCTEAVAARLRHAQPDGAAAGAAELRGVVEKMGEFLGVAHEDTVKWRGVLDEMEK